MVANDNNSKDYISYKVLCIGALVCCIAFDWFNSLFNTFDLHFTLHETNTALTRNLQTSLSNTLASDLIWFADRLGSFQLTTASKEDGNFPPKITVFAYCRQSKAPYFHTRLLYLTEH